MLTTRDEQEQQTQARGTQDCIQKQTTLVHKTQNKVSSAGGTFVTTSLDAHRCLDNGNIGIVSLLNTTFG